MIRFGPAGNSENFYSQGHKTSVESPKWLHEMGLNAYEYQCGKGVHIPEETARQLGKEASLYDIALSIHAPYYINMSGDDPVKRENSRQYIYSTLKAASWMNAKRIVVHPGSCGKMDRRSALNLSIQMMKDVLLEAKNLGFSDILICPETMGKMKQIGTLDEVIELCKIDDRLIPTVDFGHVNARSLGGLVSVQDFEEIILNIQNQLGHDRAKHLHCHFSRIEFTAGGEKKHWTLADTQFGPNFEPLAEVLCKMNLEPIIICESAGTMAEDAVKLKLIYEGVNQ